MTEVRYVRPTDERLLRIAEHMDPLDRQELDAALGMNPLSALQWCRDVSVASYVALADGVPQVAFGIADNGSFGAPWLLATREIVEWKELFVQLCAPVRDRWLSLYDRLVVITDARHYRSHRWLNRWGLKITQVHPEYGTAKTMFYQYELCAPR